jgi:hypothetical protein
MSKTYFVHYIDESLGLSDVTGLTLKQAQSIAAGHVGNNRPAKPFPNEDTYLYGPGDGTTCIIVREEWGGAG